MRKKRLVVRALASEARGRNSVHALVQFLNKPRTAKVGAISKAQKVQNFQNMLMTFFMKNSQKSFTQRKPSVLGKRFRSSDIAAGTNASTCF